MDDDVLIGGFIVTGTARKQIIVRAIGPSLPLNGALLDPLLELHRAERVCRMVPPRVMQAIAERIYERVLRPYAGGQS